MFIIINAVTSFDYFKSDDKKAKEILDNYGLTLDERFELTYKCTDIYSYMYVFEVDDFSINLDDVSFYSNSSTNLELFEETCKNKLISFKELMNVNDEYKDYSLPFDEEYYYLYAFRNRHNSQSIIYDISYIGQYSTSEIYALYFPNEKQLITFVSID